MHTKKNNNLEERSKVLKLLIFTDLDGTLLDHQTYSYDPALPALKELSEQCVPVIFTSSKTEAEISSLQQEIGIKAPAITENGGGVSIPEDYFSKEQLEVLPGKSHDFILSCLDGLPGELRAYFEGFCDWDVEQVAEKTGLNIASALLAKDRQWSVPGLWSGDERGFLEFTKLLEAKGLQVTKGGRFIHIMGRTSKGKMLNWLVAQYSQKYPKNKVISVALGDAPNDKTMLEEADYSFIIPNVSGNTVILDNEKVKGHVRDARYAGPEGWNDSILSLLKELKIEDQGENV